VFSRSGPFQHLETPPGQKLALKTSGAILLQDVAWAVMRQQRDDEELRAVLLREHVGRVRDGLV
jgi:hypothetical protein